jgi:patatin-like phospholipase/acyl hydrolase
MKRILALDGGGVRGVFTLEVLLRIEELLREHYKQQDPGKAEQFVLRDHFDFFAGTSTGAIIATGLCWGMKVERILKMYIEYGQKMFQPVPWYRPYKKFLISKFESGPLCEMLQGMFIEDGKPALLGSKLLRKRSHETGDGKLLLVVVRNHSTGSAWPLTNNPDAVFNDESRPDCNLNIPLWELVRASTAAPVYFAPAELLLGKKKQIFVDGGMTPYNNPALIAALTAVLPGYMVKWPTGAENIRIVSVGTIQFSSELRVKNPKLWLGFNVAHIPVALLQGTSWQQDFLCRCLGKCLFGEKLDREAGPLMDLGLPGREWFSYVRYNQSYKAAEMEKILKQDRHLSQIDAVEAIPRLRAIGADYARNNVKIEHLI